MQISAKEIFDWIEEQHEILKKKLGTNLTDDEFAALLVEINALRTIEEKLGEYLVSQAKKNK